MINKPDREVTIIEGNWQTGKTSLLHYLGRHNYGVINEPMRTPDIEKKYDLDNWYAIMHQRNLEIAVSRRTPQAVERSLASNLAFMKVLDRSDVVTEAKIARIVRDSKRSGLLERVGSVALLKVDDAAYMEHRVPNITDPTIAPFLHEMSQQFLEYQAVLQNYLFVLFPHAKLVEVMSYEKTGFVSQEVVFDNVARQLEGTL